MICVFEFDMVVKMTLMKVHFLVAFSQSIPSSRILESRVKYILAVPITKVRQCSLLQQKP